MNTILSDDHEWIDGPSDTTVCEKCKVGYFTRCFQLTWWQELTEDRCDPDLINPTPQTTS